MKTAKKGIVLLLMVTLAAAALAQSKSLAQKADALFDQKQYIAALAKYEEAYGSIKGNKIEKNRLYFQMAECYRLMNNFPKAEHIYRQLVGSKFYTTEPKIYFYLAEMYRFENKLEEAEESYKRYIEIAPNDKYAVSRLNSLAYVGELFANRTRHVMKRLDSWNTEYNDWAPRFMGADTNRLVFTSSRIDDEADAAIDAWTGQAFSDLYHVFRDRKGNWSATPERFEKDGRINSPANEGEACFSPDGRTVYFSRCDARRNQTQGCYIYVTSKSAADAKDRKSKKKGRSDSDAPSAEWEPAVRIELGDTAYNYLYPAVTSDGLTLYFSSDMPGGSGDYDLWVATRPSQADDFGKPVNLGSVVNTAGREVFPVLRDDTLLYFSSNGLPGVGGQDLFCTAIRGTRCTKPQNLGVPINSSYDEMSIIYYPSSTHYMIERGYFSSNRPFDDPHNPKIDNKGKKIGQLHDDLFYFELPPLRYSIEGIVRDEKSMQLVEGARILLVGSDGSESEVYTDKKGFYRFGTDRVRRDVIYKLFVSKVDYFTLEESESTRGYTTDKDIVHDMRIEPVPKQPVVLPEIRYDLSKWDLKEEFMDSLMDLYLVMMNNPDIVVEIRAHTDCQPFIGLTNDTLSQRRAQSVVDYLVSRGIERDRLVAKGYAERMPRTLDRDITVRRGGRAYNFSAGTTLECDYINRLPGDDYREVAHQLNRRIEFQILRTDYVPRRVVDNMSSDTPLVRQTEDGKIIDLVNKPLEESAEEVAIIHDENMLPVAMIHSSKGEISCIVNGARMPMLIDERFPEPVAIAWEEAMSLLYQRRINKEDFPERDNAFDPEGNILDKATVIFKEMQIGPRKLANVEVVVVKGVDYKFTINRSGLSRFGGYEFDKKSGKLFFLD
ncbi:MAG: peptidoglycan-associated lipoprotein [bacterium P3]|nr:MAG: peptidoglycan-associated lipoprotein [bacterium P3]KWW40096.1 MAG: peptidoglycan-associated lipoprotein [bacterium F083]